MKYHRNNAPHSARIAKLKKSTLKRRRHRNRHPNDNMLGIRKARRAGNDFVTVSAPSIFSFLQNPEQTVTFFNTMKAQFNRGKGVFVDLDTVTSATPDAILTLVSRMKDRRFTRGRPTRGSVPRSTAVQELLSELGFYKHVSSKFSSHQNHSGVILRKRSRKVEPDIARELIAFATRAKYGTPRKCGGVYRVLIESMANTRDHAALGSTEVESWWVSAYRQPESNSISFVFVDNGVGIFRSAKLTTFLQTWGQFITSNGRADILRQMLNGTIGSRTGLSYRGKGLPGIKNVQKRTDIKNLVIITNNIIGHVDTDNYSSLSQSFDGTIICWEI